MLDYLIYLLSNIIFKLISDNMKNQKEINNILYCSFPKDIDNRNIWIEILKDSNLRIKVINHGENIAKEFCIKSDSLNHTS